MAKRKYTMAERANMSPKTKNRKSDSESDSFGLALVGAVVGIVLVLLIN